MTFIRKFEWLIFILVFGAMLWGMRPAQDAAYTYEGDHMRYINYAVSLNTYGVFGLSDTNNMDHAPKPGRANAPLYPALLAGIMRFDNTLGASLNCIIEQGTKAGCAEAFRSVFFVQMLLGVLSLFLIYLTALQLSKNRTTAWIAAGLAMGSGIFTEFSYLFMTEILILPLFLALVLACLILHKRKKWIWVWVIAGLLAILTLTRPPYLYLFYGFVLFFFVSALLARDRSSVLRLVVLVVGFAAVTAPWAVRNKIYFDSYALSGDGYAEAILVQRINYNQMSWPEVGVAMIYWLPDFGDSLARKIFPEHLYDKMGWDNKSYYAQQYRARVEALTEQLGSKDKILGYLIKENMFSAKHVAVSVPLAMRGTFIAKYWGLAGFIAFMCLLVQTLRRKDYTVLVMSLPLFFMVAFHAGLSVSIPRYNLPLIGLFAVCMAQYIHAFIIFCGGKIVKKIKYK